MGCGASAARREARADVQQRSGIDGLPTPAQLSKLEKTLDEERSKEKATYADLRKKLDKELSDAEHDRASYAKKEEEAIAHEKGHRTANTSPHRGGGAESHTHRSSADTLHVSARLMWPALSPLLSPFQRRRAEPVSAGDQGAARDAGMRDGSVGSVPKADRLGCELRQPPFLYLDHVQAVGGRAGWPRAGGGEGVRR